MKEVFKSVKGYDGIYEVSNIGRVKSLNRFSYSEKINRFKFYRERILKPCFSTGYSRVVLAKKGTRKTININQLVAVAFLGHTLCGFCKVINHIDFNKTNNNVNNLEIVTSRENSNRKHIKSSSKYTGVSWHKRDSKWSASIRIDNNLNHLGYFKNELQASLSYQKALKEHLKRK